MIHLVSFSYKHGPRPSDDWFVFDCRVLRNPHFEAELRNLDGRDKKVQAFVGLDPKFHDLYAKAKFHALTYPNPTVAFGCFGGRHRSAALAEIVAGELRGAGYTVEVEHTALQHA